MRIIDPKDLRSKAAKKHHRSRFINRKTKRVFMAGVILIMVALWTGASGHQLRKQVKILPPNPQATKTDSAAQSNSTGFQPKTLSAEEFRTLAKDFDYPNASTIDLPQSITGNPEADKKIREIAESRGYHREKIANSALDKIEGFSLQPMAITGWQNLKTAAFKEGIVLGLSAGFRSPDEQRLIFLQRLGTAELNTDDIAAGRADEAVDAILIGTAIPGYSKHHTGYTIDLKCNGGDNVTFNSSTCNDWLNKNNYENAKKFGWVPSYPTPLPDHAPEPEPWQYIYVGLEALRQ